MIEHERAFVEAFVIPGRKERCLALLSSGKKRRKFLDTLREDNFEESCIRRISSHSQIQDLLSMQGAPKTCYVMSENAQLDRQMLDLGEALSSTVAMGLVTVISCIAGQLAYFEGEWLRQRFILSKQSLVGRMSPA
jgi:hypothetical protein